MLMKADLLLLLGILSMITRFPCAGGLSVTICEDDKQSIGCGEQQYIHVKKARYGRLSDACTRLILWSCSGKDVLTTVRNICGLSSQTCKLEASSRIYGSSCNWGNLLRVDYECKDIPAPSGIRIKRLCENRSGFYGCPNGMVINIVSAFYGRKSAAPCAYGDTSNTNCYVDARRYARYHSQGKDFGIASANSAEFGDPCPGITKYLEIRYECKIPAALTTTRKSKTTKPKTRKTTTTAKAPKTTPASRVNIKRLCENRSGFYGCPNGMVINIVSAFYGRKSAAPCAYGDTSNTNCYVDARRYARYHSQGKDFGIASANSAEFGDPCPGITKYLEIRYECKSPVVTATLATTTSKPPKEVTTPITRPIPPGSCGISQVAQSRIINGQAAKPGAWPWQVAMYRKGFFQCGGSLINPNWIVTATHCVEGMETGDLISDYYVVLGDHDRSVGESTEARRQLQKIILHPDYNKDHTYNNDIAMLKLDMPVLPTKFISPVCLPQQGQKVRIGKMCFISGWGMTAYPSDPSIVLQQGSIPVISKQDCVRRLKTAIGKKGLSISDQMLCAGQSYRPDATNTDTAICKGDSGGPFVCQETNGKWTLEGVTSWGSARCSAKDSSSVFARVSEFRNWIDEVIQNDKLPVTVSTTAASTTVPQPPPRPRVPV